MPVDSENVETMLSSEGGAVGMALYNQLRPLLEDGHGEGERGCGVGNEQAVHEAGARRVGLRAQVRAGRARRRREHGAAKDLATRARAARRGSSWRGRVEPRFAVRVQRGRSVCGITSSLRPVIVISCDASASASDGKVKMLQEPGSRHVVPIVMGAAHEIT